MLLPAARQVVQEREERTDDDDAPVELGEGDEGSHGPLDVVIAATCCSKVATAVQQELQRP